MNEWLNAASQSRRPAEWGVGLSYGAIGELWPVATVCVVSLVCTALWLLAVRGCLRPRGGGAA